MALPHRPQRPLSKHAVMGVFKGSRPAVFSETARPSTLAPNIRSVSWSSTGALLAHCVSVNIRVWNAERPDVRASTEMKDGAARGAHGNAVEKVVFNPRYESILASTGLDGMVKIWDVRLPGGATGIISGNPGAKGGTTSKAAEYKFGDQGLFLTWHPDGDVMLAGRRDDVVHSIDMRRADIPMEHTTAADKYELTATDSTPLKDRGSFNAMSFSNMGEEVFATTAEGPVKILDYPTMKPLHELSAHTSSTYCAQHSPLGNYVVVGGSDGLITLWDTYYWHCSHLMMEHTSSVRDISFSFDGNFLVAGSGPDGPKDADKGMAIYHVESGECMYMYESVSAPTWVAWHPWRYAIAYAGDPGGLKVVGSMTGA